MTFSKSSRDREREADMSKIEARERKMRATFEASGGVEGEHMVALVRLFQEYHDTPRPESIMDALARIHELNLMSLPEHRHAIAGALRGVMDTIPHGPAQADGDTTSALVRSWKEAYRAIMESVTRLIPPDDNHQITRPGQIDYLGMRWLVTRNRLLLERVCLLALRNDEVGQHTLQFLQAYQGMPEVREASLALLLASTGASPIVGDGGAKRQQVDLLVRYLLDMPGNREQLVYVGWIPTQDLVPATFVVATLDGARPKHCPQTWQEQPVTVRKATPAELIAHHKLAAAGDQP